MSGQDDDPRDAAMPNPKRPRPTSSGPNPAKKLSHRDYTIGWISAIFIEFAAAQALFDEVHESLLAEPSDNNQYKLGRMGQYNVVIACLGEMGMNNAATVANNMIRSFTSIKLQLVVGVAGGVPTPRNDVRLGDVVVGSKVIQYDFGKIIHDGQFQNTATVYTLPNRVKAALTALRAEHDVNGSQVSAMLSEMVRRKPNMTRYASSLMLDDTLFQNDYDHPEGYDGCELCDSSKRQTRPVRANRVPQIHFGTIASGNMVVKDAQRRDDLGKRYNALCLEMEGAALKGNDTPFLVIRGICDYSDSHKNKQWQPYAATTAAACAKEVLSFLQPDRNDINRGSNAQSPQYQNPETDPKKQEKKYDALIASLNFEQMHMRQDNIKGAHGNTCTWLLNKSEFLRWLDVDKVDEHHGLLWIKGKPGTGKSTIMKFALEHFQQKKRKDILISFFFNARGDQIEKSVHGMYRTLLRQILIQLHRLRCILDPIDTITAPRWSNTTLQGLLRQAVRNLEQQSLVCFVDALDECDPREVRDMVYFFEDLGVLAIESKVELRVCFASRHYPHITVRKAVELLIDGQEGHEQDIFNYINDKLRIGTGKTVRKIHSQIQAKAAGIFMWVVLVTKILNEHSDSGLSPALLQQELEILPQDLHALFRDILLRSQKNRGNLLLCVRWILFARQPLSPEEFYLAIHSALGAEDTISTGWHKQEISQQRLRLFVLSTSQGLVEITQSIKPVVQFIHESVNDFFLKGEGLREVWPDVEAEFEGRSHDVLKCCCLNYISIWSDGLFHQFIRADDLELELYDIYPPLPKYPFMRYAINNILWHAEQAQLKNIEQGCFLQTFTAKLKVWRKIHNSLNQNAYGHYAPDISLLYLLAERELAHLIRAFPTDTSCLVREQSQYGLPFIAAVATDSFQVIRIFVNGLRASLDGTNDHHVSLKEVTFKARSSKFDSLYTYRSTESLIFELVDHHNAIILDVVFRGLSVHVAMKTESGDSLLHRAEYKDVAAYLVGRAADVNALNSRGQTPLHVARNENVVAYLIQAGAAIDVADRNGETPLHEAAYRGSEWKTRLLLDNGASTEAETSQGRTPLSYAVERKQLPVLSLLAGFGAAVNCADKQGNTPVHWAVKGPRRWPNSLFRETLEILLTRNAAVDARNHDGRTPLSFLVQNCWPIEGPLWRILLDHGAAVDCRDRSGKAPWHYATENKQWPGLRRCLPMRSAPAAAMWPGVDTLGTRRS